VEDVIPPSTTTVSHRLSQFNGRIIGTFNMMDGPLVPYIDAGFGWTYVDSNVADGPPTTGCWWHPWWGYICSNFWNTYSSTETSYGVGLGLRYEIRGGSFIKGSYNYWKLNSGGASDDFDLGSFRVEYGWNF
jgi:opacity protein-like surface antigen